MTAETKRWAINGAVVLAVGVFGAGVAWMAVSARAASAEELAADAAVRVHVVEREQAVATAERREQSRDLEQHTKQVQKQLDRIENDVRELHKALVDERTGRRRR